MKAERIVVDTNVLISASLNAAGAPRKFLETVLMGEADCLITGDRDLLVMSPFHDIPILTPADCLARLQEC
ncbi:MAG: hypothetical protein OXI13_03250 [Gammaproteobacteria bacterium]|nr:hypothetical protein [Gammaproteobacteria bacterium]